MSDPNSCLPSDCGDTPVHHIEAVQVLKGAQEFGAVEPTSILVELSFTLKMVEEFPSVDYVLL